VVSFSILRPFGPSRATAMLHAGAGLLGYLGLGGQPTKATEDDYAYDFEGKPQEQDDEHYDFGDDEEPELDEDELLAEEGLKDDRLEARLALAYDVATAGVSSGREHPMKAPEFRKAAARRRPIASTA
jgi:hypothetical protein